MDALRGAGYGHVMLRRGRLAPPGPPLRTGGFGIEPEDPEIANHRDAVACGVLRRWRLPRRRQPR